MIETRKVRVVIIEDDEFMLMVYHDIIKEIKNINFEVQTFQLLNEGINKINNTIFDVLLLDLNLPDSTYIETIERIPALSILLPVIIMTSTDDELLALKTMNMGSQDYLLKTNLDKAIFLRSVLFAIERHQLRNQLRIEKERSDLLLRNILPFSIAEELKHFGKVKANQFQEVSVLFVDFAKFTSLSENMNPMVLVDELNACFSYFDEIMERFNLEKIKTIGDSYMCAGGIPIAYKDHTLNIIKAAFEIRQFIEHRFNQKLSNGLPYWRARIGIHVGPVIAGVVGSKKFTYDIWGDTVNTASRMESSGEVGKINISGSTYELIKNDFNCEYRGKIQVKGKGEIDMYFVENL